MKNRYTVPYALALLATATPVLAAGAKPGDWYVGGAIGSAKYKAGYQKTADTIFSTGATVVEVTANNTKPKLWKTYVGYQFTPNISVEGTVRSFGKASYDAAITAPAVTTMHRSFDAWGVGTDVVLWLPLSGSFSAFGKVGGALTHVTASMATPGGGLPPLPSQTSTKFKAVWGIGAQYEISNALSARLEYEYVPNLGDNSTFGTANVGMLLLGLSYKY